MRENLIKAALIDWLFDKGMLDDAVIINEMVVANWSRRADLVLANGRLYGFEIKSEVDTLKRLPGQVDAFMEHFDKVIIVAATKFVRHLVDSYPPEVGILEVRREGDGIGIKQIRAGRISEIKSHSVVASHLTKGEIDVFLRANGLLDSGDKARARVELLGMVSRVPLKRLKEYVLETLKRKYRGTFDSFVDGRISNGTLQSLQLLSKTEHARRAVERRLSSVSDDLVLVANRFERELDFSMIEAMCGAGIDDMPRTVLVKKRP